MSGLSSPLIILEEVNATRTDYPRELTIHEVFSRMAELVPNHTAITESTGSSGSSVMTYEELELQSDRLAWQLRERGITEEGVVAIVAKPTHAFILAILAVLKAGAAYLPLEPSWPVARIRYILEDCQPGLLLTDDLESAQAWHEEIPLMLLSATCAADGAGFRAKSGPDHTAYILYTSGSTGRPKGVKVTHRNVNRLVLNTNYINLTEEDRVLQTGALTFDLTTFEIWGALLNGASLHLHPSRYLLDPEEMRMTIIREGITVIILATALFHRLASIDPLIFSPLRSLLVGGDVLHPALANRFRLLCPQTILLNCYGPTENTVFSTFYQMNRTCQGSVPIGRPISNSTVFIVDEQNQLILNGEPGELLVGGDGVAKEYVNRMELTSEKFIDNPFGTKEGRLYRTGDLVRWLPDGNIEYVGRIDQQIKIRGYRIEPGEILHQILACPGVREAFVTAGRYSSPSEELELCAYIVLERDIPMEDIQHILRQQLPDYMLPPYWVRLEQFPLLSNGKIDRNALPPPEPLSTTDEEERGILDTAAEIKLAELWQALLRSPSISRTDNFFHLGGNSLKAVELLNNIRRTFHVKARIPDIFDYPTLQCMAERIGQLENQRYHPITKQANQPSYPLSSAQKRLYMLHTFHPASTAYNEIFCFSGHGPVDTSRLEWVFRDLIVRHESLRTVYRFEDNEPKQWVQPPPSCFPVDPLHCKDKDEACLLQQSLVRPFDLTRDLLLRARLILLPEAEFQLFVEMHHIAMDGVSAQILYNEAIALYRGEALSQPRLQYRDYSLWQQSQRPQLRDQRSYWLQRLSGPPPVLELPLDAARPEVADDEGGFYTFRLERDLTDILEGLAAEANTTVFTILFVQFALFLSKICRQKDCVIGVPVANRSHADLQSMVGMFVNTLPIRVDLEGFATFKDLMDSMKDLLLRDLEHQEYQFDDIVEDMRLERMPNRNPLYDVVFVMQDMDLPPVYVAETLVEQVAIPRHSAKFDLSVEVFKRGHELHFMLEYRSCLFHSDTIARLANSLKEVIRQTTIQPDMQLSLVELVSVQERKQLLELVHPEELDTRIPATVTEWLEKQCRMLGDEIAIRDTQRALSYREWNERANQLAHSLIGHGIKHGNTVAVMADRSCELAVAFLALMKIGAVYLPIDQDLPVKRIQYMLEHSKSKLVLANATHAPLLNDYDWINLDNAELYLGDCGNPDFQLCRGDPVYLIYTSGSTGQPKGIMTNHGQLLNFLLHFEHEFAGRITSADHGMAMASISFDASIMEFILPLAFGASLQMVPSSLKKDIRGLADLMIAEQISLCFIPPTYLEELSTILLEDGYKRDLQLDKLIVGAEPVKDYLLERISRLRSGMVIINAYGPTEACICCCTYNYHAGDSSGKVVPIGRPVSRTKVVITDPDGAVVPHGVPGEIVVYGAAVAEGYLNSPELTEAKFNTSRYYPGVNSYRTGDLGRWLPDGNMEFLGRTDSQLKIRGNRVEPGEIEYHMLACAPVREAAVISLHDELHGFFVAEKEDSTGQLRQFLRNLLPGYMLPSTLTQLAVMPTTSNGKIDKASLKKQVPEMKLNSAPLSLPATSHEWKLTGIWQSVLGHDSFDMESNFFEIGGHSMRLIRVLNLIEQEWKVKLSANLFYRFPTVKELSPIIASAEASSKTGPAFGKAAEQAVYLATLPQARIWKTYIQDPHNPEQNMPIQLSFNQPFVEAAFRRAWEEIINRHECLRTSFTAREDTVEQIIDPVARIDLEIRDYAKQSQDESRIQWNGLLARERMQAFDLRKPPLHRMKLAVWDSGRFELMLIINHAICDGWSLSIIEQELKALYNAYSEGGHGSLAVPPYQFKDYSEWHLRLVSDHNAQGDMALFWKDKLAGVRGFSTLPYDYGEQAGAGNNTATALFRLVVKEELAQRLKAVAIDKQTSLFMILLSVFHIWIASYTSEKDIVTGIPSANRHTEELAGIVGYFVDPVIVRSKISPDMTYGEYLNRLSKEVLESLEFSMLPIENVCALAGLPCYGLKTFPLWFNMTTFEDSFKRTLEDLHDFHNSSVQDSKFELALYPSEYANGIELNTYYYKSLYRPERIEAIIGDYVSLLQKVSTHVEWTLGELTGLS